MLAIKDQTTTGLHSRTETAYKLRLASLQTQKPAPARDPASPSFVSPAI